MSSAAVEALPARLRFASIWIFAYQGILLGAWAGVIPQIQVDRDIDNALFGRILVAAIIGALLAVPVAAKATEVLGANVSLLSGCLAAVLFTPVLGMPPYNDLRVFVVGVVLLGFVLGILDISANFHVTLLERRFRTKLMGFFFAVYSAGCVSGALICSLFQALGFSVLQIFVCTSLSSIAPCILSFYGLYSLQEQIDIIANYPDVNVDGGAQARHAYQGIELDDVNTAVGGAGCEEQPTPTVSSSPPGPKSALHASAPREEKNWRYLTALTCIGFLSFLAEGSISDWSGIYLKHISDASPPGDTGGYVLYSLVVMVSRYQSDQLAASLGTRRFLVASSLAACAGFVVVASACLFSRAAAYYVALAGFAVVGGGLGGIAPTVVGLSGKVEGFKSSETVAMLSAVSYLGILIGPPLLGFISVLCRGLQYSLLVEAALVAAVAPLAWVWVK